MDRPKRSSTCDSAFTIPGCDSSDDDKMDALRGSLEHDTALTLSRKSLASTDEALLVAATDVCEQYGAEAYASLSEPWSPLQPQRWDAHVDKASVHSSPACTAPTRASTRSGGTCSEGSPSRVDADLDGTSRKATLSEAETVAEVSCDSSGRS